MRLKMALVVVVAVVLPLILIQSSLAWKQEAHRQINAEAALLFIEQYGQLPKYKDAQPFASRLCQGIGVKGSHLDKQDHENEICAHFPFQWLVLGGDWADEPNLYASLRHFYDPLRLSGYAYLTDQWYMHGVLYESPETDLKTWSINHAENPFCFANALVYYKKSLEISELGEPQPFNPPAFKAGSFRLEPFKPRTLDEERQFYLALAFRALGESLHGLADMTQPAHTRNDSHPLSEPIEDHVWNQTVLDVKHQPLDPIYSIVPDPGKPNSMLPQELFHELASVTNYNFFSADTIYDAAMDIQPRNDEKPYASPQLANLEAVVKKVNGCDTTTWYGSFGNDRYKVPLASEMITSYLIRKCYPREAAESLLHIPPSFAAGQASVLIPAAIHACAAYIDMFYPTLELKTEIAITADQPGAGIKSIAVESLLLHSQVDPAWLDAGLTIRYSGPALLVISQKGKTIRTIRLAYEQGLLAYVEDNDGKLAEKQLVLYFAERRQARLGLDQSFYALEEGQTAYIELIAGDRIFRQTVFQAGIINPSVYLDSDDYTGNTGEPVEMRATPSGNDRYRFIWDFGDGQSFAEEGFASSIQHVYQDKGTYAVRVTLQDLQGMTLNQATSDVIIDDSDRSIEIIHSAAGLRFPSQEPVTLMGKRSGNYTYVWNLGDGTVVSGDNLNEIEHRYSSPGTYPVSLTLHNKGSDKPVAEGYTVIVVYQADFTIRDFVSLPKVVNDGNRDHLLLQLFGFRDSVDYGQLIRNETIDEVYYTCAGSNIKHGWEEYYRIIAGQKILLSHLYQFGSSSDVVEIRYMKTLEGFNYDVIGTLSIRTDTIVLFMTFSSVTPYPIYMLDYSDDGGYTKVSYSYFLNGQIMSEEHFRNGKKHGISRSYNEDGTLFMESQFVDGVQINR